LISLNLIIITNEVYFYQVNDNSKSLQYVCDQVFIDNTTGYLYVSGMRRNVADNEVDYFIYTL